MQQEDGCTITQRDTVIVNTFSLNKDFKITTTLEHDDDDDDVKLNSTFQCLVVAAFDFYISQSQSHWITMIKIKIKFIAPAGPELTTCAAAIQK